MKLISQIDLGVLPDRCSLQPELGFFNQSLSFLSLAKKGPNRARPSAQNLFSLQTDLKEKGALSKDTHNVRLQHERWPLRLTQLAARHIS